MRFTFEKIANNFFFNFPEIHQITLITLMSHVFVILLMMLDFLITGNDINLFNAVYTVGFGCTYAIFSFIYYSSGGLTTRLDHKLYPFLDWEKPETTLIVCCVGVICVAIVHFLFILISYVRNIVVKKLFVSKVVENEKDLNNVNLASV
jgi:hypothetical protein